MIRVYSAMSLDGFLAGEGDDLTWLEEAPVDAPKEKGTLDFAAMMAMTGAMVMGRRTYDIVRGFDGPWPYGEVPVLVATRRPLGSDVPPTVEAIEGPIDAVLRRAQEVAMDRDVYLDGGQLISQALEAHLVDELILTIAPVFLGRGVPLYGGAALHRFRFEDIGRFGDYLQVRLRPLEPVRR